jgi:DNA primase
LQIPQRTIDEIRDRADIVDVVSRFVDLRRAGVNYKAVCPFHEEKTPSFVVSPDKQIFHCFGCSKGGNVFSFIMEMEGISFPEAVRELGKQYGVEVEAYEVPKEVSTHTEALYRASDFAARWYQRNLVRKETGRKAQEYLLGRGIPEEAWETFQLGYAGEAWDHFYQACKRKNVPMDILAQLKLIVSSEKSKGYFDYFRNRVMYPIALLSGRVVAFGAGSMAKGVQPKYLNSVESPIYSKRRILYGSSYARDAMRKHRRAILVEGYTDCISMHLHGYPNTVASCGTAITPEHATLLRRLTREVILMPDGDAAGQDSAIASGAVFVAAGLDVKVARLEAGQDPDDTAKRLKPEDMEKIVAGALEYLPYLDYIISDRQMSPREKESVIHRVAAGLGNATDNLRYEVLTRDLARILNVSPESLQRGRNVARRHETGARRRDPGPTGGSGRRAELEKSLLRLLLEDTPQAAEARGKIDSDDFSEDRCREFYKLLDSAWENHIDIRSKSFRRKVEKADLEGFAAETALISIPPGNLDTLLKDTVRRVKELKIRDELSVLREKLHDLPEESEEAIAVAEHYAQLKRALSEL